MGMSDVDLGIWSPAGEHASFAAEKDEVKFRVDVDAKPEVGVKSPS